ncbi:MAG: BamA/TamA family outer membrane protein [Marinilabiliaceae bacterium]|nr:BamA/TamA family outer membrane protein [Marinilabiliaceae bacterium]
MRKLISILGLSLLLINISAQSTKKDSTKTNKEDKNLRFSILGGPGYTPDFGVLIGGSALFTFRTDPSNIELKRSVVPVAFAITFTGGLNLTSRPQLFYNNDRFRIFGQFSYRNTLDNYSGVGYETNKHRPRGSETTEFRNFGGQFNPIFLFKVKETNLFVGPLIDITYDRMSEISAGILADENYLEQGGDDDGLSFLNSGLGLNVSYDTRDIPANAYSGVLFDLKYTCYAKALGSDQVFSNLTLEYRHFMTLDFLGERKSFGWMVQSKNSFGDVPISRLAFVGSPFDLRGYYMGQYRDNSGHLAMVEYRNMFNSEKENLVGK